MTTKLEGKELNAELISIDVGDAGSYQCKGIPVSAGQKYRCVLSPVESSGRQWTTKLERKELNAELISIDVGDAGSYQCKGIPVLSLVR